MSVYCPTIAFFFTPNRMSSRPDDIDVGQCCYEKNVLVTTPNKGGRDTKSDPKNSFFEHFSKDLWPIIVCCEEIKSPSDENCLKVLNEGQNYFAKSFTRGYSAPQVGKFLCTTHDASTAFRTCLYQYYVSTCEHVCQLI